MTRYRDGYRGSIEKYDFSFTSIRRALSLVLIPIFAYIIGLLPVTWSLFFIIQFIDFTSIIGIVLFTILLVIEFFIFIIAETFIPGLFIRLLRLKIKEGEYDISIKDKDFYKYSLYYVLYRPSLKLIGVLPLLPLRIRFLTFTARKSSSERKGMRGVHSVNYLLSSTIHTSMPDSERICKPSRL